MGLRRIYVLLHAGLELRCNRTLGLWIPGIWDYLEVLAFRSY